MSHFSTRRLLGAGVATVFLAGSMSACSADTPETPANGADSVSSNYTLTLGPDHDLTEFSVESQPEISALLPDSVKDIGAISVGIEANAGYPNSVTTGEAIYGLTPDLAKLIGGVLGVEIEIEAGPFPSLIPSLQSGRYDMSTSLFFDREERREILELVDVQYALGDLFVLGPKSDLKSLDYSNVCGVSIGVISGGSYIERLETASQECIDSGQPAADLQEYPSTPDAMVAVQASRIDAFVASLPQSSYIISSDPERLRPGTVDSEVNGYAAIAFPLDSDLVPAVRAAMLYLNDEGLWAELLKLYGSEATAPSNAVIENLDPFDPENVL